MSDLYCCSCPGFRRSVCTWSMSLIHTELITEGGKEKERGSLYRVRRLVLERRIAPMVGKVRYIAFCALLLYS